MKKNMILILLCIVLSMTACTVSKNDTPTYELIPIGIQTTDSTASTEHMSTITTQALWTTERFNMHTDTTAPPTATVTFNGKQYQGSYSFTHGIPYCDYLRHVYEGDEGRFEIHAQTGALEYISLRGIGDGSYTEQQCRELAAAIASEYIDPLDYTLSATDDGRTYHFNYAKYMDSFECRDYLSVTVAKNGLVIGMSAIQPGQVTQSMDTPSLASETLIEQVKATAHTACGEHYDEVKAVEAPVWTIVGGKTVAVYRIELSAQENAECCSEASVFIALEPTAE